MKPFLLSVATAMAALLLSSATAPSAQHVSATSSIHKDVHFYFYMDEDDSFDGWSDLGDEIVHLESIYGGVVNTSGYGGVLLAEGYSNNSVPHTLSPAVVLFLH